LLPRRAAGRSGLRSDARAEPAASSPRGRRRAFFQGQDSTASFPLGTAVQGPRLDRDGAVLSARCQPVANALLDSGTRTRTASTTTAASLSRPPRFTRRRRALRLQTIIPADTPGVRAYRRWQPPGECAHGRGIRRNEVADGSALRVGELVAAIAKAAVSYSPSSSACQKSSRAFATGWHRPDRTCPSRSGPRALDCGSKRENRSESWP